MEDNLPEEAVPLIARRAGRDALHQMHRAQRPCQDDNSVRGSTSGHLQGFRLRHSQGLRTQVQVKEARQEEGKATKKSVGKNSRYKKN